jgi:hypothetical protein
VTNVRSASAGRRNATGNPCQRVPLTAYWAMATMLDLSMKDGPVRTACPPPMVLRLLRYSQSDAVIRTAGRDCRWPGTVEVRVGDERVVVAEHRRGHRPRSSSVLNRCRRSHRSCSRVHAFPLQAIPCRSAKYLFGGPRGGDERYGYCGAGLSRRTVAARLCPKWPARLTRPSPLPRRRGRSYG